MPCPLVRVVRRINRRRSFVFMGANLGISVEKFVVVFGFFVFVV